MLTPTDARKNSARLAAHNIVPAVTLPLRNMGKTAICRLI